MASPVAENGGHMQHNVLTVLVKGGERGMPGTPAVSRGLIVLYLDDRLSDDE